MAMFSVAFIGCGRPWKSEGATGFGMAHAHAMGYKASPDCEIVALADISAENARAFQEQHGGQHIYADYREMLAKEKPDIVSICTWPHLHAEMVIACCEAGVKAVHCEKPLATTWGDSKRMVEAAAECGVQLTFNHQRRFGEPFQKAKELLDAGRVGQLIRLEGSCPNMFDWGTHWFDMFFFYNNETPVEWVIGQIEPRGSHKVFGVLMEGQGISHWKYRNGVHGLLVTGHEAGWEAANRLVGTEGVIEVGAGEDVPLRVWGKGRAFWENVPMSEDLHGRDNVTRAVLDLVDALKTGREPMLSARKALQATELIFATYESSRKRGRVDLPLQIDDNPFQAMVDAGEMRVEE